MRFIREEITHDDPTFKKWVYGPPSQLTPDYDPEDDTCYGPCCWDYFEDEEEIDDL